MLAEALRRRLKLTRRRTLAQLFFTKFATSILDACRLAGLGLTACTAGGRRRTRQRSACALREIAHARPRYDATRIGTMRRPICVW
jgi:hypothetical protein